MNKKWMGYVLASCVIGMTGCAGNQNDAANTRYENGNAVVNRVSMNNNQNRTNNPQSENLTVSTRAASNIERLNEVDQARVIIRDNDAFVAVRLTNQGNQGNKNQNGQANNNTANTQNVGNRNTTGNLSTGNYAGALGDTGAAANDAGRPNNNTGTRNNAAIGNAGASGDIAGRAGTAGTNGVGNNGGITGNLGIGTNVGTARNTGTGNNTGAGNTTGMIGNNNGGTTAGQNGYSSVSTALEQKIADQVRAADKDIHEVFVSVNDDFYNQMTTYSNDLREGRNGDGLFEDFTNTVRTFFNR